MCKLVKTMVGCSLIRDTYASRISLRKLDLALCLNKHGIYSLNISKWLINSELLRVVITSM